MKEWKKKTRGISAQMSSQELQKLDDSVVSPLFDRRKPDFQVANRTRKETTKQPDKKTYSRLMITKQ